MSEIEVEQITIKIGKKQLTLSQEQANELLEVLAKLLGKPQTVEKIIERPYPYWRYWYVTSPTYPNWTWTGSGTSFGNSNTTGIVPSKYTVTLNSN